MCSDLKCVLILRHAVRRSSAAVATLELVDTFVDPSSTIMSPPNAPPNYFAGNGAARDVHCPDVPELGPGGLSAVLIVERPADHRFLFRLLVEAAALAATSNPTSKCTERQDRATGRDVTAARDQRNETRALRLMYGLEVKAGTD
jgi:hypothetical protein